MNRRLIPILTVTIAIVLSCSLAYAATKEGQDKAVETTEISEKESLLVCLTIILAIPVFSLLEHKPKEVIKEDQKGHMEPINMCNLDMLEVEMGGMIPKCLKQADKLGISEEQTNYTYLWEIQKNRHYNSKSPKDNKITSNKVSS